MAMNDFIGREVYSRDGYKVGEVKQLAQNGEYVVIDRSFGHDLLIPLDAIDSSDSELVIPLNSSYLDDAPEVDPDRELSMKDKAIIDRFYMPRAA